MLSGETGGALPHPVTFGLYGHKPVTSVSGELVPGLRHSHFLVSLTEARGPVWGPVLIP